MIPQWILDKNLNNKRLALALSIAQKAHKGQFRKSGEPYINHPMAVAQLIYTIGGNEDMLCAALLHDAVEDAEEPGIIKQQIINEMGKHVYDLVMTLSKNDQITDAKARQQAYFQQFCSGIERDIEVVFIKVADLTDNLKTIVHLKPHKRTIWLQELTEGYLPIISQAFDQMSPAYRKMYHRLCDRLVVLLKI